MLPGAAISVFPVKTGIQSPRFSWIPTFVGMTVAICDTLRGKDGFDAIALGMGWIVGMSERGPGGLPAAAGRAVRQRSGGGTAPPGKRGPPGRLSGRSPTAAAIGRDDCGRGRGGKGKEKA